VTAHTASGSLNGRMIIPAIDKAMIAKTKKVVTNNQIEARLVKSFIKIKFSSYTSFQNNTEGLLWHQSGRTAFFFSFALWKFY